MKRYGTSKARIALFLLLIGAAFCSVTTSHAQEPATQAARPAHAGMFATLMGLVLQNMDVVFATIMLCSVVAVALIIKSFLQVREAVLCPEHSVRKIRSLIQQGLHRELIEFTQSDPTFISQSLCHALKRAPDFSAMKETLETAIGEQTAEQFRKIEYLNIIGNLGPLLGLLGTVLGMIDAFAALQAARGAANPADLAGGISAALTHTFLGLMLAVPCLAAFGVFRTKVDRLTVRGSLLAEELLLEHAARNYNATSGNEPAQVAAN